MLELFISSMDGHQPGPQEIRFLWVLSIPKFFHCSCRICTNGNLLFEKSGQALNFSKLKSLELRVLQAFKTLTKI